MPPSTSAAMMSSSTSVGDEAKASQLSSNVESSSTEFEIPRNFVPPPRPREVATGVSNLGNTCYMNAALQALAHAPELCHALDAESHLSRCPVALRNERRRRKRAREMGAAAAAAALAGRAGQAAGNNVGAGGGGSSGSKQASSRSTSPTKGGKKDSKKSHRRSNSGSSNGSNGSGKSSKSRKKNANINYDPDYEFCTLCELERLMGRVHSRPEEILEDPQEKCSTTAKSGNGSNEITAPQDGPFVPEAFVSGFMTKVAPWFRRGIQEDSHEFLRLLIDAMQNSCKGARDSDKKNHADPGDRGDEKDIEYPFRLFRGTVESNVKCSACRSTSRKIDPIEDIGLDILPMKQPASNSYMSSTRGGSSMSSSRSTSPTSTMALADVTQALERFISSEHLDSGYKCEKCGKLGKATKTSKLASIPPILTLHLKRFRYGAGVGGGGSRRGGGNQLNYNENGGGGGGGTRSSRSARGSNVQNDFDNVGPSGSAKIEGHVRFNSVLDVKPYLTKELQTTTFSKAICRLFAVVVHSGKNSHSGHYVAYVHNVTKKEWWKMDDAKVVRVSWQEVQNAEAYMLFYRVMSHPVGMQLKGIAEGKEEKSRKVIEELKRREEAKKAAIKAKEEEEERTKQAEAEAAVKAAMAVIQKKEATEDKVPEAAPSSDREDNDNETPASSPEPSLGKRSRPALASGEEWARAATTLSPEFMPLFSRIQEFITDNVTFSPEFFAYITEEYNRMSESKNTGGIGRRVKNNKRAKRTKSLLGKGPGGVHPPEDVVGGADDIQGGILDLFHQVSIMYKQQQTQNGGGNGSFLLPKILEEVGQEQDEAVVKTVMKEEEMPTPVEAIHAPEVVPLLTIDNELIIPADNNIESYDGAL